LVAVLVLTIMIVPITSSICRELFLGVPTELEQGALALGATRWEMVRGVVLPYTRTGVSAAVLLGFGRAIGEAIAATQVSGAGHYSLTLSPRTRRRKLVNLLMQALATLAALAAVAVLALVIISVAQRGASALSWDFFTKTAATFGQGGGGVANALVGSLVIVGLATAMAVPVGILVALYVSEFAPPRI